MTQNFSGMKVLVILSGKEPRYAEILAESQENRNWAAQEQISK